ncbi:MAG: lipase family protein, partial [Phycisphaerae bacterium]|nr:lipase family protein [Phycisphaerae bacterium]
GAGGGGPAGVGAGAAASSADRVGALAISASNAATVPALAPGYWSALARAGAWRTLDPEAIGTRLRLAQLSAIAYRPAPIAEQLLRDLGAAGVEFFDAGGTQAFACRIHDDVVVSFRGTQPREVQDLVADANIALRPFVIGKAGSEITVGRAHAGFAAALRCVLAPLEKRVLDLHEGDARIWLTGHSLGGALASLLCAHLAVSRKELAPRLRLVTFAAPRVGDQALRDEIGRRLAADSALHVALERDPVPLVPPWSMDFRHLGTVRTFSIGGVESTGEGWRALLDTLMDASTDLRRAGAESLRRHGIEVYIAALEQTAEVASA